MKQKRAALLRCFAAALALVLAAGFLPGLSASAADLEEGWVTYPVEGGDIYFDPETRTVSGSDMEVTAAVIPEEIGGVPVERIGRGAFWGRPLAYVELPDSVTVIEDGAFYYTPLQSLDLPASLKVLDFNVFYGSSISSLTIPASVEKLYGPVLHLEELRFLGSAPACEGFTFAAEECAISPSFIASGLKVYYPGGDPSWAEDVRPVIQPSAEVMAQLVMDFEEYVWTAEYGMLEGENAEFTLGGEAPVIRADCDMEKFVSVAVDGTEVAAENYAVRSGSTIVEFTEAYLNTLTVGAHTVCLTFTDGVAEAVLTVNAAETELPTDPTTEPATDPTTEPATDPTTDPTTAPTQPDTEEPKTGDETNVVMLTALMLASVLALTGAAVLYRKRSF